jgi:hypothetical protein
LLEPEHVTVVAAVIPPLAGLMVAPVAVLLNVMVLAVVLTIVVTLPA